MCSRKKLRIDRIQNAEGERVTTTEDKAAEVVKYFEGLFTADYRPINFDIMQNVPRIVTDQQMKR